MRLVFAGTPEFSVAALEALVAAGHEIAGVYTQPDRPAGRGRKLSASPVAQRAEQLGIALFKPAKLRGDDDAITQLRALAPDMARTATDTAALAEALAFVAGNDQFFLNVAMAMGKAIMDPVRDIEGSSIVTAMSRNGTDFGILVSGTGDEWFTAPVEMPEGLYFPGFTADDANPDMGDSTIVETIGLGGFAMAAAPAVAGFVGAGAATEAALTTREMAEITLAENPEWTIPSMDYLGVPTGIDIRLVVETGLAPTINTGIAHREPGVGQVGAGLVRAPMACFEQALVAFADRLGVS